MLASLARHDVIPVLLWDSAEFEALPELGLARLRDPESGAQRTLMLRPRLKRQIVLRFRERQQNLTRLFRSYGREPLLLLDGFDPARVTEYFYRAR